MALSAETIAELLSRPVPATDDFHMTSIPAGLSVTDAAVMVPLVHRPQGLHVLLTQRTEHLSDHGGQVSFPGGRVERADLSREETALRETEEEIGIAPAHDSILGRLQQYEITELFH